MTRKPKSTHRNPRSIEALLARKFGKDRAQDVYVQITDDNGGRMSVGLGASIWVCSVNDIFGADDN